MHYTAFSRVTSLAGLTIADWGPKATVSKKVVEYMTTVRTSNTFQLHLPHTSHGEHRCLQLLGINIRGLHTHANDVQHHATQRGAKVMLLSETHWCDARAISALPNQWTWFFAHAASNTLTSAPGGVAIAVHNSMPAPAAQQVSHIGHGYQFAACVLYNAWTVVVVYREPTAHVMHFLNDLAAFLAATWAHGSAVVVGDFNINMKDDTAASTRQYTAFMHSLAYVCISNPQHPSQLRGNNLDHTWVKRATSVQPRHAYGYACYTDHMPQHIKLCNV
jgi:exonuclease III